MNFRKSFITVFCVFLAGAQLFADSEDVYYKINKSFELFGAAFRQVALNYVMDIDPEVLVKSGIEGMFETLDPYTDFYDDENEDELDFLKNDTYTGLGININLIDSVVTVTNVLPDYSAAKAGIKVGDVIYQIDSVLVGTGENDNLRMLTKGEPGSKLKLRILRYGVKDTLTFEVERKRIKLKDIYTYAKLDGNIAYIGLSGFSNTAAKEFRETLYKLNDKKDLQGVIIDLRGNPGGYLDAAIEIAEMFVPKGSLIVTTQGRGNKRVNEYKAVTEPLYPNMPVVVLINEKSASASEVLAGAFQDLDRGVIIGRRSYGKGLVQNMFDLPYNTSMKITTAKYYTPSGRCIQRLKIAEKYNRTKITDSPDTNVYYTKNGRKVYESTGITPDIKVPERDNSDFTDNLLEKHLFFKFGTKYIFNHPDFVPDSTKLETLRNEFATYLKNENYKYKSKAEILADSIKSIADSTKKTPAFDKEIADIANYFKKDADKLISEHSDEMNRYLDFETSLRVLKESDLYRRMVKYDENVKVALEYLNPDKYLGVLDGAAKSQGKSNNDSRK